MSIYKDEITTGNTELSGDPLNRFVGYGLKKGRAYGTLANIPDDQIIDMPIAENLMMGVAIGLSLKGLRPVVFFERMDFTLNASDAIVNHLDKIHGLSHGEFSPAVIIRCVVGNRDKPLYTGAVHTQDFSKAFKSMVDFPVVQLRWESSIRWSYEQARLDQRKGVSTMLVEYRDFM